MAECKSCLDNSNVLEQNSSKGVIYLIHPPIKPGCTSGAKNKYSLIDINLDFLNKNKLFSDNKININI